MGPVIDHPDDATAPTPTPDPAQTSFTVAMTPIGHHGGQAVDVTLGSNTPLRMQVDTGADIVAVTDSVANSLISNG